MKSVTIQNILADMGYEILEERKFQGCICPEFTVRYSLAKIKELKKENQYPDGDYSELYQIMNIEVTEVCFNGEGGLSVAISRSEDPDGCWDGMEYEIDFYGSDES
jgi:hypothetical protein